MARIHGRKGALYLDLAGGGTASPVSFLTKWDTDFSVDQVEVTSMDDASKVYVTGLPDSKISVEFVWDNVAASQLFAASQDGIARKMYLYPDRSLTTQYWYNTSFADFKVGGSTSDAVRSSGTLVAATSIFGKNM